MPRLYDAEIVHTIAARHASGLTADPSRSDHWNKVTAARAYRSIRQDVETQLASNQKTAAANYAAAYRRAFSIDGLPGDPASLHTAMRAAIREAQSYDQIGGLAPAIDRARLLGDEIAVRALSARAVELRDVEAINRYDLEDTGPLHDAVQTVWDGEGASNQMSTHDSSSVYNTLADYRPAILGGTTDPDIDRLADQDPAAPPAV